MKFAPLHIYSSYSFLKSGLTIEKIINAAKINDYFGVGISDIDVMYGVPNFAIECEKINKPYIVGMEIKFDDEFLCLYAINEIGYRNLSFITSNIHKNIFASEQLKTHKDGLIAILDTHNGKVNESFKNNDLNDNFRKYLLEI